MGEEVNKVIDNICDKLGILASELIPEMGRMKVAECGSIVAFGVIGTIIAVILVIVGMKKSNYCNTEEQGVAMLVIGIILMIFALGALVICLPDLVGWLASPKAKTFEFVLSKIGGSV